MSKFFNIYKILFQHIREAIKNYFKNWKKNLKFLATAHPKEKLIALTLALLTFIYVRLQDIEQRNLFVPLQIEKIDELTFANDFPHTVSLFVSGNRSALNNLDVNKIIARVDLTDITSPGVFHRSPILESVPDGIQVLRINPQTLEIELSNLEKKLLRIEPSLVGSPRKGFRIQSIDISPTRLWVFGPKDILNDITKIETEPINIDDLDQSKQVDVAFNKNIHPGLRFDRTRSLEVLINIESEYVRQNLVEPILVNDDLGEEWALSAPVLVSNVSFEIHKDSVSDFHVDQDLFFSLDTKDIEDPGSYTVAIKVQQNKKIRRITFTPRTVRIEVLNQKSMSPDLNKSNFE